MATIEALDAYQILDSRGRPTVAARVTLSNGLVAEAHAPSGASTGRHEAVELRDGDPAHYAGLGVLRAVENVKTEISSALAGRPVEDQAGIDRAMIDVDGTPDKSRLGANAIVATSCAVARAAAMSLGVPLWRYLAGSRQATLPLPMINILSGGLHAEHNIEFQDFLVMPHGFQTFAESLEAAVRIHAAARDLILGRGYRLTGVADEGGWGPALSSNVEALDLVAQAIGRSGYRSPDQVSIAIDVASTHFYRDGAYHLATEDAVLSTAAMIERLDTWSRRYPVLSIEDGLHEDAWEDWPQLTRRLGDRVQVLGDDLFTSNPERVRRGVAENAANAVLVKMNQIGTLTETFQVIDTCRAHGWKAVVSARSGETEDSFLSDLAVAAGGAQIKVGSITRSERLAKYNRLLAIEKAFSD